MLRFVNANRTATVAVLAASLLIVATMSIRFSGGTTSREPPVGGGAPAAIGSAASSRNERTAGPASPSRAPSTNPAAGHSPTNRTERLGTPFDPSGLRGGRSEEGARQSAVDFASTVQQRLLYLTPETGEEVLQSWLSTSASQKDIDATIDDLTELRSALTAGGGNMWWSVSPIAVHVEAFDLNRARVMVWCSQIVASDVDPTLGGEATAPTIAFYITTVDLVWGEPDGWSIWNVASTPGPVPMMATTSRMSSPIEFMDTLGRFTLIKEHS